MNNKIHTNKPQTDRSSNNEGVHFLKPFRLQLSEKNNERSPDENPYLNRVMILNRNDFYGRKTIVRKLFTKINTTRPQSVSITGDRKIGKSSLLGYLKHPEARVEYLTNPDKYIFVYIDLQQYHTNTPKDFFIAVFDEIIRESQKEIVINVDPDYKGFIELAKEFERNGMIFIFLFDEFEVITQNDNFSHEFFAFLRSMANNYRISFITTSRLNLRDMCRNKQISDSPFFNIFTNLFLGPFELAEAKELIISASAKSKISLEQRVNLIFEMAGQLPFFIQIAGSVIFDLLMNPEEHSKRVFIGIVEKAFMEEAIGHFDYMLDNLTEPELKIVQLVSCEDAISKKYDSTIRELVRRGVVVRTAGRLDLFSYLIKDYILIRYKLKNRSKKKKFLGLRD